MDRKQLAQQLNGIEYPCDIPADLERQAREAGLVIVFGASDDLMEFRGAITDEIGVDGGGEVLVSPGGVMQRFDDIDHDDINAMRSYFQTEGQGVRIKALWCTESNYSWMYGTEIPHETFEVMEDGEPYCRGLVFALQDTQKANLP